MLSIPDGWQICRLRDMGKWLSGGTPPTGVADYWNGDIPWISAASLKEFRIRDSIKKVTALGAGAGTRRVDAGAVLFVVRGMSLSSEFRVGVAEVDVTFGQDCKAIIPAEGVDSRFLAYALKDRESDILGMADESSHGTKRLSTSQLGSIEIPMPPLDEQRRIVDILGSMDCEIERTRAEIVKLQKIKEGMAADLLSGTVRDRETVQGGVVQYGGRD